MRLLAIGLITMTLCIALLASFLYRVIKHSVDLEELERRDRGE